jgi:hypothetical protein
LARLKVRVRKCETIRVARPFPARGRFRVGELLFVKSPQTFRGFLADGGRLGVVRVNIDQPLSQL